MVEPGARANQNLTTRLKGGAETEVHPGQRDGRVRDADDQPGRQYAGH
jgi:hypothetical protein